MKNKKRSFVLRNPNPLNLLKKDEDDDDEEKPVKKEKNPLDLRHPSTFNLFDFKTLFVNAPNKFDALKFFWKNFDNVGYSI